MNFSNGEKKEIEGAAFRTDAYDAQKHESRPAREPKVKPKSRRRTKAQIGGADEDQRFLRARRNFHADMLARFPEYLAKADEKIRAAEAERAMLIEKHAQAPDGIAECERLLASLERTFPHLLATQR
jgi:hypothetical protein